MATFLCPYCRQNGYLSPGPCPKCNCSGYPSEAPPWKPLTYSGRKKKVGPDEIFDEEVGLQECYEHDEYTEIEL